MRSRVFGAMLVGACISVVAAALPSAGVAAVRPATTPRYQYGINTYVSYNCVGAPLMNQWMTNDVKAIKALGANAVAIAFPLYTNSISSNVVYAKDVCNNQNYQTPTPGILAGIISVAKKAGLRVLLRPLIDQTALYEQNPNYWRGVLQPSNLSSWFQSYLGTLRPYLIMAQQTGVNYFALETELDSLTPASEWNAAVVISHDLFKGQLVWNYSWNSAVTKVTRAGTTFGIDAYPDLPKLTPTSTVTAIASAWGALLKKTAYKVPKISTTTIDEVGINAQNGAYANPSYSAYSLSKYPFNQKIQANWFSAACSFMKGHHMQGIYYWGPWLTTDAGHLLSAPNPNKASNIQPLAQAAIKKCFG